MNLASVLVSVEVVAARCSGAGAYLRHAVVAGDMKPCGHDQRELTQICRPHRVVGHADTRAARWPWPDLMPPW